MAPNGERLLAHVSNFRPLRGGWMYMRCSAGAGIAADQLILVGQGPDLSVLMHNPEPEGWIGILSIIIPALAWRKSSPRPT
jgi:hypothetical protein